MVSFNVLISVALAYALLLFGVAFFADRRAALGARNRWLRSPWTYTLSLSVYCTAWTFYGAVGSAARSGLEYLTIYLGPTLVFLAWWWLLRKLVRIGKAERITSVADMISSRYGKSPAIAVVVTLLAIAGTTPYIALQLQSVTLSVAVFTTNSDAAGGADLRATAFWLSAGLAAFTILFGTRNLDANERHFGVVTAIAVEAVVKLVALLAVGIFVVWGVMGGLGDTLRVIETSAVSQWQPSPSRWTTMIFLSAVAVICLPRMFQVLVVENSDERHLRTAAWAFPLYMMAISLFVLPIAVVGLAVMPEGANPDLFVLTLPLELDQQGLALLAFLGGFSSATSMVIVASIALATMVSNHIIVPIFLATRQGGATVSGDMRKVVLVSRRLSIVAILALGYMYFSITGGSAALSAIGLVSFAGLAQVLPALLGGLFWRGATRRGALAGLSIGFALWGYTLFLPAIGAFPTSMLTDGPFQIAILRPQALMGLAGLDPLVHSVLVSIALNALAFVVISLVSFPTPMERLQGASFVNVFERSDGTVGPTGGQAEAEDLLVMAQRLLGAKQAQTLFERATQEQGKSGYLPDPTPDFIAVLERELAGSVGAAASHAMIAQINGQASVSVQDLMAVADESAQMLEYSSQLEDQSRKLEQTARQLREANEKLTALSEQKDAFLSQVSHELRTPMTSVRSFSEFLMEGGMKDETRVRYSRIINEESIRLTRLLDDLLDLSVLENGQVVMNEQTASLHDLLDRAVASSGLGAKGAQLQVFRNTATESVMLSTDTDRLSQVFINLISNAQKYCKSDAPQLRIEVRRASGAQLVIDFIDNGPGIAPQDTTVIFEKFVRLSDQASAGSAGLGLAISREIMLRLGGSLDYVPGQGGAAFRVKLPVAAVVQAA